MNKKIKNILTISLTFLISLTVLFNSYCLADYSTVIMSVVDKPVNTIKFSENSKFTKQLVSQDLNNKEVTIELKLTNEEKVIIPTGELVIVMDNSRSMTEEAYDGKTRIDVINSATKTLISSLLDSNDNLKIGIVSFSTKALDNEGTLEDAQVLQPLTKNETELDNALDNMNADGYRTDLQAGIEVGKTLFTTEDTDKYMVILTDGLPNVCIYSNLSEEDQEIAKREFYCTPVIDETVKSLKQLGTDGIKVISMLTGIADPDQKPTQACPYTYKQYYEKVFGTPEKPTVGTFFYTEDKDAEKVITQDILNALKPEQKTLKDITVKDVFPAYITSNFDFAYASKPNIGTITNLDLTNRTIEWTIDELKPGEVAVCTYVLKLKQNFSQDIVGQILKTNENVEITYTDFDGVKQDKENDTTPTLKLEEPPADLPYAGNGLNALILCGFVVVPCIFYIRYKMVK